MPDSFTGFHGWDPDKVGWKIPHDPIGIWQQAILGSLATYEEELNSEFGENWTIRPSFEQGHEHEVILTSGRGGNDVGPGFEFRCYMTDHHADARLVVDDYIPEVHGGDPIEDEEAPVTTEG